ncbi:helix-turn-helix domain-containing protein [Riemerella anatipestifer]|uniref:Helix-turn-helix domain-containing protein n=2 Tax=Weeksellaceae TaxID=2762318 RepID=A0AAP3AJR0_RIEAN|nr:helix-turn-helix domain-containing protein [Riemerella anatipestifer]AZZ58450.1 DNA-binding protein [Riemerella anatipestifer]MBO4232963.1 helix-turn-helix domain-containing protein [Riemerella anatipestifer]MBT0573111.1 helix-turn-helix domain-containing protein [Riemerella anatipestifer]MCO7319094.1 helix-turn-helix domain-containing protein [Riemerella anatipestifer]MCQ4155345.1 helix-turn-helix domain-containing protein [Riemerella anatipestifer]
MKLITIEENQWLQLRQEIQFIREYIQKQSQSIEIIDQLWLNNHEVCQYLHLSEKTLWRMRQNNEITYSKVHGQYFYTLGSIRKLMEFNVVKSTEDYLENLTQKAHSYVKKGRPIK